MPRIRERMLIFSTMRTKQTLFACSFVILISVFVSAGPQVGHPYRLSDREVARLIDRIRSKTNIRAERSSRLLLSAAFEQETKRLDDRFDHHKSTVADVDSVMQRASRIWNLMTLHPLDARVQGDVSSAL